ncbi:hypothetical protein PR202_gb12134 [Eleusine coracana subsp. coracana]|uniref:Uncharacterized protein n=1 Tax=Eleusine coracana subsp. coracana TaxID=191504 RepID=A0AAV5EPA3_ELECO|nr:hypothetical protein QOZ80_7BG0585320 [Eleusine coracana subsp. coracana]GJN24396.1 hypothetical protein PR202_gb12134 [Eleusine coracana subsp. coracana]
MGQCVSSNGVVSEATAPTAKATALVLLPTGELREYPRPATASLVLEDSFHGGSEGWFLCDSDKMGFEGAVAAVGGGEDLRAGRIYFVLPADARRRGLSREEVAALAVKAADALAKAGAANSSASGNGRRRRGGAAVAPLVFSPTEEEEDADEAPKAAAVMKQRRRPAARSRRTQQRRFAPDLTAIPEGEMSE